MEVGLLLLADDGSTDKESFRVVDGVGLGAKYGAIDGNAFVNGDGDKSVLGLILGTEEDFEDDMLLPADGSDDGEAFRETEGVLLNVKDDARDGNSLGNDDGTILGLILGTEDGV